MNRQTKILIFFIVATAISAAFNRPFYDAERLSFIQRFALAAVLVGMGPTLAALLSWRFFGVQNRTASLLGTWPRGATIAFALPTAVMALWGCPNRADMNPHLMGALLGLLITIYALGEEIGWRGYLNDALKPLSYGGRVLFSGTLWWAWHLWFLEGDSLENLTLTSDYQRLFVTWISLIGASALFVAVVDQSRSLMVVAAFHAVGNIAYFAQIPDFPREQRLVVGGVAFAGLLIVDKVWKRRSQRDEKPIY